MHKVKNIFRNINLLNIILITSIIILANYTVLPMFNMNIRYTLPAGKKTIGDTDEKPADSHIPSLTDYTMIAEENLFHPERKIPAEKKAEQPLPKPDFVLYGTLITDDIRLAYLEDLKAPYSTLGRGKRQRTMHVGDSLSSYTLTEINHDRIVMVRGDDRIEVKLLDSQLKKTRLTGTTIPEQPFLTKTTPAGTKTFKPQGAGRSPSVIQKRPLTPADIIEKMGIPSSGATVHGNSRQQPKTPPVPDSSFLNDK
jgi:hypothetical protein